MASEKAIKQIQQQINCLEQEKHKIEMELTAAKHYLDALQGNYLEDVAKNKQRANQSLEAREKMSKAQRERQERERQIRIKTIKDFLADRDTATIQEVANRLKVREKTAKRYLRSCSEFQEARINVWQCAK